jgi:hypothetical protein
VRLDHARDLLHRAQRDPLGPTTPRLHVAGDGGPSS